MKILLVNQEWFKPDLQAWGHEVVTFGRSKDFDAFQNKAFVHIDQVCDSLPGGFRPDCIVFHDNSSPVMLSGLEETTIPTFFYSVDTHHHVSLHRHLAQLFDGIAIAQKDYLKDFEAIGFSPPWIPLWASRPVEASAEKKYDAVFVGNMNKELNPDRVAFFEALQKEVPVFCTVGKYWEIFPHAEIVINQTVKGDLNFRVFEAMMCGSLLLTENSGNGLCDLFEPGKHLACYERCNVKEAADQIRKFLADRKTARAIAHQGREEILRAHTTLARAALLEPILKGLGKSVRPQRAFGAMINYSVTATLLEPNNPGLAVCALLQALRSAEIALERQEPITQEISCHLVSSAMLYDRHLNSDSGSALLERFSETYGEEQVIVLAHIRSLLNRGRRDEANSLASRVIGATCGEVFSRAEELVSTLLASRDNR